MRPLAMICLALALAPACWAEPHGSAPAIPAADLSTQAAPAPPLVCSPPAAPFTPQQLHQLCNNPETRDLPRPPDPAGYCDVEVRLTSTQFVDGQGGTEGRGEISWEASADPVLGNDPETTADSSTSDYNVGQTKYHNADLGTYRVPVGTTMDVEICMSFNEEDKGGINGNSDYTEGCTTVRLRCSGQDGNGDGLPDGQMADDADIGPLEMCGGDSCNGTVAAHFEILAADADMDGVPNDDDFTPELCDEELKATAGNAVLLYWQYDDGGVTNLVQAVGLDLSPVLAAYDYVVLVADNETSNPMNAKATIFGGADMTFPPTRAGLLDAFRDLTSKGFRFDTFVFAHGYEVDADDSSFEVLAGEDLITGQWLIEATDPCLVGTARHGVPIMAWWSTTCIAERQLDAWIEVGAQAVSGAENVYFYPQTWQNFIKEWVKGTHSYWWVVDGSLTWPIVSTAETFIKVEGKGAPFFCTNDDLSTPKLGDGPGVVTEENDCAFDFFSDEIGNFTAYHLEDVYDETLSGADNMAAASARSFLGNQQLRFGASTSSWP